ncbi:MAG: Fur family transcriptional regulator [Chitinophagaceae bacterium]|nr:Fur family transcriptional regulator [Chitinophagaceae bacterium]
MAEKGLKATTQRIVIYDALMSDCSHPTAETIHELIKISHPTISLATVYKTLETFVEYQLAQKVSTVEGTYRYDGKTEEHHHIVIDETNEIIDFDDEQIKALMKAHLAQKNIENLEITDISIQIRGRKIDANKTITINKF